MGGPIIGAMRNQLLYNSTKTGAKGPQSQAGPSPLFLISPKRQELKINGMEVPIEGDRAIACGSLIGFGGLLEKEFRVHDFFLGRRNCQRFLQKQFMAEFELDKNRKPICNTTFCSVLSGYANPAAFNRFAQIKTVIDNNNNQKSFVLLPIIPDLNVIGTNPADNTINLLLNSENPQRPWPQIDFCEKIYTQGSKIKKRARWVVQAGFKPGWFMGKIFDLVFKFFGISLAEKTMEYIKNELQNWKLLK
jgi:hypothetical protein